MADLKAPPTEAPAPHQHPDGASKLRPDAQSRPSTAGSASENWRTAKRFLSAYAQTWVGMSPLWLMGEAVVPGQNVGGMFKRGTANLRSAAVDIQRAVSTSAKDIVVIIDERVQETKTGGVTELAKASEVIKAAGENALLVVTTSLEKAQEELRAHKELSPQLKKAVTKNSRDVVIILDKALKNPVVVTGISKFAATKGIPHADALLRLASLGLTKILAAMPEVQLEGLEAVVEEVDAAELERQASPEAREKAEKAGRQGDGPPPKVEVDPNPPRGATDADPYAKMKKDTQCTVM
ncbi:hypothetical protein AURDEDRAFT_114857 [Auricularia subglabra TFB-10046 SS5]|nr:hypothetical protein AURDEDRAFT_114857 [Auricularia subglabra TFB-10046 SS5]